MFLDVAEEGVYVIQNAKHQTREQYLNCLVVKAVVPPIHATPAAWF